VREGRIYQRKQEKNMNKQNENKDRMEGLKEKGEFSALNYRTAGTMMGTSERHNSRRMRKIS